MIIDFDKRTGGGGTSNYNDLQNRPKINDTTLSGNKSASDLGLASSADLEGKQDVISDLGTIRERASHGDSAYSDIHSGNLTLDSFQLSQTRNGRGVKFTSLSTDGYPAILALFFDNSSGSALVDHYMEYSWDGETYNHWVDGGLIIGDDTHPYVFIRGKNNDSGLGYAYFRIEGVDGPLQPNDVIDIEGNINDLLDFRKDFEVLPEEAFYELFYGCPIRDASKLLLPAKELSSYCYYEMFKYCDSLVNAPAIIPAMVLADSCCYQMFSGCTSLVNAPKLPALILAEDCYEYMFEDCVSLVNTPILPATILSDGCYADMFIGCSSLNKAMILSTSFSEDDLYNWLGREAYPVSASGTIYCDPSMVETIQENQYTPSGWVVKPYYPNETLSDKLTELEQNVGDLDDLDTTAKTNLVAAVNEVKGEADGKADKVSVASSIPAGGLLPNTLYNLGAISATTTISLATATDLTHLNEYMFRFSIGATVPTITLPTGVVYGKSRESVPPTLEANTGYEFSIVDGWALYESFDLS